MVDAVHGVWTGQSVILELVVFVLKRINYLETWAGGGRWIINDLCSTCAHFRIVRNKAAEKVKEIGGYESSSPGPLSHNLASDTSLPLRHPSYSINNILGVQQPPDANENILKRKREDDGKRD